MDWQSLKQSLEQKLRDRDLPPRTFELTALSRVLNGELYDHIASPFSEEVNSGGQFLPLKDRRPSVRTGYCQTVVSDSVSLLFSEGHFPAVDADDRLAKAAVAAWIKETSLNEIFIDAATKGSIGSIALMFRVARQRPFVKVLSTAFLTPVFSADVPDELVRVVELYKVYGSQIAARVPNAEPRERYWFRREWTADQEIWYTPWRVTDRDAVPAIDPALTVDHGLGFVPIVWIRNLPGGDDIDGACTFTGGIDSMIAADYTLSQARRALIYGSDPKLVIKTADGKLEGLSGGTANALVVSSDGDAKLLEINGTAAEASIEYEKRLRVIALEAMHGNRADADKVSAAQSGRALELMNQGLIWLADRLRISYGEKGLLALVRMVIAASAVVAPEKGGLIIGGQHYKDLRADGLRLTWPRWYAPTAQDRQQDASTAASLVEAGIMSRRTVLANLASDYDVENIDKEIVAADADRAAADERAERIAARIGAASMKVVEPLQSE
jgi:hypothetical protein